LVTDGDELPTPGTVVRYVGFNKMAKDEDDRVLEPLPSAFEMRPNEEYLSITWAEYYVGASDQRLRCAVEAIRSSRDVGPKGCFCVADLDELMAVITTRSSKGRAVYLPQDDNPAHAGIYGVSSEETLLQQILATTVWSQFLTKELADNLPFGDCAKAPDIN
jgi:hypothetical protein